MVMKERRKTRPLRVRQKPAAVLRAQDPADFLGVVPYLLGFHPSESLVLVLFQGKRLVVTARVDLVCEEYLDQMADRLGFIAEQHHGSRAILIGYSADADLAQANLDRAALELAWVGGVDALYADGRRWWSRNADGTSWPAEGLCYDLSSDKLAAEAVFAGLTAHPDRADIARQVAGPPGTEGPRLAALTVEVSTELESMGQRQRQELMADLVQSFLADPNLLGQREGVRLAVLARDIEVRDVAWALMERRSSQDHVDLWRQVVAVALPEVASAPLCLLGMAAWIHGNGALQVCCIERAQIIDPSYTLAALLEDINARALPPSFWDQMASEMRELSGPLVG